MPARHTDRIDLQEKSVREARRDTRLKLQIALQSARGARRDARPIYGSPSNRRAKRAETLDSVYDLPSNPREKHAYKTKRAKRAVTLDSIHDSPFDRRASGADKNSAREARGDACFERQFALQLARRARQNKSAV